MEDSNVPGSIEPNKVNESSGSLPIAADRGAIPSSSSSAPPQGSPDVPHDVDGDTVAAAVPPTNASGPPTADASAPQTQGEPEQNDPSAHANGDRAVGGHSGEDVEMVDAHPIGAASPSAPLAKAHDSADGADDAATMDVKEVKKPEFVTNAPKHPVCVVALTDIQHQRDGIFSVDVYAVDDTNWIVATGGGDARVGIWLFTKHHKTSFITFLNDHQRAVHVVCFGPTAKPQLATGSSDCSVYIYEPVHVGEFKLWKRINSVRLRDSITDLSWTLPKQILIAANEPSLFFFNIESGERVNVGDPEQYGMIKGAKVDPLGHYVAALAELEFVPLKLWVWEQIDFAKGRDRSKNWVPVYPTQKAYMQTSDESRAKGIVFARPSWDPLGSACCFPHGEFAQDKNPRNGQAIEAGFIASGVPGGAQKRHYAPLIARGNWTDELAQFRGHPTRVTHVQFGPVCKVDGAVFSLLASASQDGTVVLWKSNTRDALCVYTEVTDSDAVILDLSFTPDGKTLLVSTTEARITSLTFDWSFTVCTREEVMKIISEASMSMKYQQPLAIPSVHSSVRMNDRRPLRTIVEEPSVVTVPVIAGKDAGGEPQGSFECGKEFTKGAMQCGRGGQVFLGRIVTQVSTSELFFAILASNNLIVRLRKNGLPIVPSLLIPFPARQLRLCDNLVVVLGTRACIFDASKNYALTEEIPDDIPFKVKDFGYRDGVFSIEGDNGVVAVYIHKKGWLRMDTRDFRSPFLIPPALVQSITDNHPLRRGWVGTSNTLVDDYVQGIYDIEHRIANLRAVKHVVPALEEEIRQMWLILKRFYSDLFKNHTHIVSVGPPPAGCPACFAQNRLMDLSAGQDMQDMHRNPAKRDAHHLFIQQTSPRVTSEDSQS
eukprot:GEMP01010490.1.p1 GENE.GEMP01010490.1~~GEMP01010490.1.p1  ORF type:complete len:884 (+),score=216.14 GEMP01010490.1:234-2885(+)